MAAGVAESTGGSPFEDTLKKEKPTAFTVGFPIKIT